MFRQQGENICATSPESQKGILLVWLMIRVLKVQVHLTLECLWSAERILFDIIHFTHTHTKIGIFLHQNLFCMILNQSSSQQKALVCEEVKQKILIAFTHCVIQSFSLPCQSWPSNLSRIQIQNIILYTAQKSSLEILGYFADSIYLINYAPNIVSHQCQKSVLTFKS